MMAKMFMSEGDAYVFYNQYAKECWCSIRRDLLKRGKGPEGSISLRRYLLSRAGKWQAQFYTMEDRTRRLRLESRCICESHLTVKLDKQRAIWYASSFTDDHNHVLARLEELPFILSHNQIKGIPESRDLSHGMSYNQETNIT